MKVKGINGDIAFIKQGPAGKESAQNVPSVYLIKIEDGKVDEDVGFRSSQALGYWRATQRAL